MDAQYGDMITFKVKSLDNCKISVIVGLSYNMQGSRQYLFTEKINKKGGFISFPFPYEAYFTISYDQFRGNGGFVSFNYEISMVKIPN